MTMTKEFIITRTFEAPRSLVWKAWTMPAMLAKWFGPKGANCQIIKHELRIGGIVHSRLAIGNAIMWGKFTYQEITPESRLVWLHSFSDETGINITRHPFNPGWPLELLTTLSLVDDGRKTRLTLTWTPVNASEIELEAFEKELPGATQGWGGSFDQLSEILKDGSH